MKMLKIFASAALLFAGLGSTQAAVIGFEDQTSTASFYQLGILNDYQGFEWGDGSIGGLSGRTFFDITSGWGAATSGSAMLPPPANLSGNAYAWNAGGSQSLWIDFRGKTDVSQIDVAVFSPAYSHNANTIQLFGYGADDHLIGQTAALSLIDSFQTLAANLSGVRYLEIRSNAWNTWFSVDNLVVNPSPAAVPLPGSFTIFSLGLAGMATLRRRRQLLA